MTARPFLSGIVLAAGRSRRMGRPKQLLPLRGRPLLQWAVDAAIASRLDEIVVVLGHAAEEIAAELALPGSRVRAVEVSDWDHGQSASLRGGFAALDSRADAAVILLGDQPLMTGRHIDAVIADFLTSAASVARPVHMDDDGEVPGHPVIVARALWPEIEALTGDQGLRALLPGWEPQVSKVRVTAPSRDPVWADVDTPEDYQRLLDALE